jgi:hypothetical protein
MKKRLRPWQRPASVWSLLVCLLFVNAFMAAPSVGHAAHHANHEAGTHSSGLCAWLCAAGEGVETSSANVQPEFQLVDYAEYRRSDQCERPASSLIFLRGPPAFSR